MNKGLANALHGFIDRIIGGVMRPVLAFLIAAAVMISGCARTRGEALARMTMAENGRPTSVKIVSETPPGEGFGRSARTLIFAMWYDGMAAGDYMVRVIFIRSSDYEIELWSAGEDDPVAPPQ
ncbi:MAG: hypothetical protein QM698_13185 [Micropepsaceae bacterium]